jgi:hypothetical protein
LGLRQFVALRLRHAPPAGLPSSSVLAFSRVLQGIISDRRFWQPTRHPECIESENSWQTPFGAGLRFSYSLVQLVFCILL